MRAWMRSSSGTASSRPARPLHSHAAFNRVHYTAKFAIEDAAVMAGDFGFEKLLSPCP